MPPNGATWHGDPRLRGSMRATAWPTRDAMTGSDPDVRDPGWLNLGHACRIVLPEQQGEVAPSDPVQVQPFAGLL